MQLDFINQLYFLIFLRAIARAIARICYGNSVHPSVTRVDCIKTAEHIKILLLHLIGPSF